jgi:hypothetical protein
MSEQRFCLALDCGDISTEEVKHYEKAPAYIRARAVWKLLYDQVMGKGGYLSIRTMMTYGHAYSTAYGENVPRERQLQAFHIMDRYRQEHGFTFVQLPEESIDGLFKIREEAMTRPATTLHVTPGGDVGALYESHEPRVRAVDDTGQRPVPIDPPFESIPLYYEKQVQESKVKKSRPFLERFYLDRRLMLEQIVTTLQREGRDSRPTILTEQAVILAAQRSRKYLLTDSALRMIATLMEHANGMQIRQLPDTHIFLELASPIDQGYYEPIHGMFFQSLYLTLEGVHEQTKLTIPPFAPFGKRAEQIWTLSLLNESGGEIITIDYEQGEYKSWRLAEMHECPQNLCRQIATPQEMFERWMFTNWQACPKCEAFATYFSRWFPIALLAIAGEFAEEAEPVEREVTETIIRKEKRPNSGKYDEHREEVSFRIITFDASVKRKPTSLAAVEPSAGPSWLDLAIEQGTIVYVKRGFGKSTRHLDPARNPRWKMKRDVSVRAYQKRIPMTVANLQKVITRVVASKFEQGEQP